MAHTYYNTSAADADNNRRSSGAAYEDIDIQPQPDIITSNSNKQRAVTSQRQNKATTESYIPTTDQYADVDDVKMAAVNGKEQDDNRFSTRTSYAEIAVRDSTQSATPAKPQILTPKPVLDVRYAELDFEDDATPQLTSTLGHTVADCYEDTNVPTARVVVPNLGEFETYAEVSERPMTSRQTQPSSLAVEQHAPSDDAPADSTVQPVYAQSMKRKRPPEVTSDVSHVSADNNPQVLYAVPDKKRVSDK